MRMLCLLGVIALYKNTITFIDLFNLLIQSSDPLSGGSPQLLNRRLSLESDLTNLEKDYL